MRHRFTLAAAALAVLAGGAAVQAQHGHSHGHGTGHGGFSHGGYGHGGYGHSSYGHGGYVHGGYGYGGHVHGLPLGGYYSSYGVGSPYAYRPTLSYPAYSYPSVVTAPVVQPVVAVSPTVIPAAGVTTSTSLKPNAIPPYTGPGVTLRLPAEYTGSVYVQVDKREVEIKPGTEVVFRDKPSYRIEFDRGGDFGTESFEINEGAYKMAVGDLGWHVQPNAPVPAGPRRNALPGETKK